jgi:hypothetical protein
MCKSGGEYVALAGMWRIILAATACPPSYMPFETGIKRTMRLIRSISKLPVHELLSFSAVNLTMTDSHLSHDEFFATLVAEFGRNMARHHGNVYLTQKRGEYRWISISCVYITRLLLILLSQ